MTDFTELQRCGMEEIALDQGVSHRNASSMKRAFPNIPGVVDSIQYMVEEGGVNGVFAGKMDGVSIPAAIPSRPRVADSGNKIF